MARFTQALVEYLKEVGWALFLLYLILAMLALLFGRHVDFPVMLRISAWFAGIVTAVFAGIVVVNLLCIGIFRVLRRMRRRSERKG